MMYRTLIPTLTPSRWTAVVVASLVLSTSIPVIAQETAAPGGSTATPAQKQSAKPGINDSFLDPDLEIQQWIDRFEVESREVYHARDEILRNLNLKPGDRVADIGAGTGFFTMMMADAVGPEGWAYAVDISPKFVEHLVQQFDQSQIENVTTVMCDDDSVCLPGGSIEVAFLCDVYHHFEYPADTMSSLHRALTDRGRVIVIDFERIPGVSREWTLGHVRAGKQTFIDEIQAAGFELVAERKIPGFQENYYIEFVKKAR